MSKLILESEHLQKLNQIIDDIQNQNERQNQGIIQLRKELQLIQQQNQEFTMLKQKNEQQNQEISILKQKNEQQNQELTILKQTINDLEIKTNNLSNTQQTLQFSNQSSIQGSIQSIKLNTSLNIKTGFDSLPQEISSLFPIEIPFSSVDQLNGIFGWFVLKKLDFSNFVELIPSSTAYGSIQNILGDSPLYWVSKNEPNSKFEFKFKNCLISVSGYSLFLSGWNAPNSWVIEGLDENKQRIIIDKKSNLESKTKGYNCFWHHFSFSNTVFCSSIKFTQTNVNYKGDHYLKIISFDFYGSLKLKP
jgi:hypothetical protein